MALTCLLDAGTLCGHQEGDRRTLELPCSSMELALAEVMWTPDAPAKMNTGEVAEDSLD
jgi:hypothetical protein